MSNVATVLTELAERMNGQALVEIADLMRTPDVQRLGYLLDIAGENDLAAPLARWLHARRHRAIALATDISEKTEINERWRIDPNVNLELDL